jgi:flagellar protein FlaI
MTDQGQLRPSDDLRSLMEQYPHLADHVQAHNDRTGEFPMFVSDLEDEHDVDRPNVLYQPDDAVFAHVYGDVGDPTTYICVEPTSPDDQETYDAIRDRVLTLSANRQPPGSEDEFDAFLDDLLDDIVTVNGTNGEAGLVERVRGQYLRQRIVVDDESHERLRYRLHRDIAGLGPLDPVMRDSHNEDIHLIGPDQCYVDHEVFGMLPTTIDFGSADALESWVRSIGERMDQPVSDSQPVIDATLPDGSRINIIYSNDVSIQGTSLTIRQAEDVPLSILRITKWGTMSPELAAYLWICMENERTAFVVGETASGKTTTLNSMFSLIPRDHKIYTAEDTAEVSPPHDNWQQLLTREGKGDGADVTMFNLIEAALRSRPDYICVGEVRGEEARMVFQAAQTGHPVLTTFHAPDIVSMVQRLTGDPINVPKAFIDNCDVVLFQNRVKRGDEVVRRVTSVQEIEGYSEEEGGIVTRQVFRWDPRTDEVVFSGRNNSYVLEGQIATLLGYEDRRRIYDELERRAEIIRRLIDNDVLEYDAVNEAIETIQQDGVEALDIDIKGVTKQAVME